MPPGFKLSAGQKRALSLMLFFSAGLYLSFALLAGKESLFTTTKLLGFSGWLFILACSLSSYLLRFLRWQYYIRSLNSHLSQRLPAPLHFSYYLAGFALTTTPAKAGETIRSFYLKSHGVRFNHSLASFFCERFQDLIIVTLLASLALLNFAGYQHFVVITALVLLGLLAVLRSRKMPHRLRALAGLSHRPRLQRILEHLANLLESARTLLQLRRLSLGMLLGLLAWSLQGVAFYFILSRLGAPLPLSIALSIYAISLLAGALSFIPGGIGATEAVMYLLLSQAGLDNASALVIPIISRVSTLWFAVLLGLLASLYLSLRRQNHSDKRKPQRQTD